jgi:hypothetical protein
MRIRPKRGSFQPSARYQRECRKTGAERARQIAVTEQAQAEEERAAQARWDVMPEWQKKRVVQLERGRMLRMLDALDQYKDTKLAEIAELQRQLAARHTQPINITVTGAGIGAGTQKPAATGKPARVEFTPTAAEEAESRRFFRMLNMARDLPTPKLRLYRQMVINGMTECNTTALCAIDDAECAQQLTRDAAKLDRRKLQKLFNELQCVAERCNDELAKRDNRQRRGLPRLLSAMLPWERAAEETGEPIPDEYITEEEYPEYFAMLRERTAGPKSLGIWVAHSPNALPIL